MENRTTHTYLRSKFINGDIVVQMSSQIIDRPRNFVAYAEGTFNG